MTTHGRRIDIDIPKWRVENHRPKAVCPVCGRDHYCLLEPGPNPELVICTKHSGEHKNWGDMGWPHWLTEGAARAARGLRNIVRVVGGESESEPADARTLDRAYSRLLRELHLGQRHHDALTARGLTPEQVTAAGYSSLALQGRSATCRQLLEDLGPEFWQGVPGFYMNSGGYGDYLTLAGSPGLLVPVRDPEGRVVGIQIRADDPPAPGMKYMWLSSNPQSKQKYREGTKAAVRVHHSLLGNPDGRLWLTEGALKADVTAALTNTRCFGVPGVSAWRKLRDAALAATDDGEAVVLAFDADWRGNKHVRGALTDLAAELQAHDRRVLVADWPTVPDDHGNPHPKGIDDALAAGAPVDLHPLNGDLFGSRLREMPAVELPAEPEDTDLDSAARRIRGGAMTRLRNLEQGATVFTDPPGVGKTSQVGLALKTLAERDDWPTRNDRFGVERPKRVLFLTDTLESARDVAELIGDPAVLVAGRCLANCHRAGEVQALGASRHNVMATACATCKQRWQAEHPDTPWTCEYLNTRERAQWTPVTVACKAAAMNRSDELRDFDAVIIDEGLDGHLLDRFDLDRARLDAWWARMDSIRHEDPERYSDLNPQRRLLRLLQLATSQTPPDAERPVRQRLRDALDTTAIFEGEDLRELVSQCRSIRPHKATGLYPFERPRDDDTGELHRYQAGDGRSFVPLRAFAEMVDALSRELNRPADADARLWLERCPDAPDRMLAYLPQENVINALRETTLLVLDATPDLAMLRDVLEAEPEVIHTGAREPVHVTQLSNSLYTAGQLRDRGSRKTLNAVRKRWQREHPDSVVLTAKDFADPLDADGHFGRDDRRHNRWEDAGALAILGHWQRPITEVEAEVQALRFAEEPPEPDPGGHAWRPYLHVNDDDQSFARLRPLHEDPGVQARLEFERWALMTQAIGRLRPSRKSEPVHVLIADADPVPALRVDRLVSVDEYLERNISKRRLAALAKANAERHRDFTRRVLEVIADLDWSTVQELSVRGLQDELEARDHPRGRRDRLGPMLRALQMGLGSIRGAVTTELKRLFPYNTAITPPCIGRFAATAESGPIPILPAFEPARAIAGMRAPPGGA